MATTDSNLKTTSFEYAATDALGQPNPLRRPTKELRPDTGETTYAYGGTPGSLYMLTRFKQDASVTLNAYQYFDGLGRVVRAQAFAGGTSYTTADTKYDSLGRAAQVSNSYLTTLNGPVNTTAWTTSTFDPLGRVRTVTTPDGAQVVTAYSGVSVTVTDQRGTKRRSRADALGRLVEVDEPDALTGALDTAAGVPVQPTYYAYDALNNLRQVTQGSQTRAFAYDSLARLLRVRNPEQATNAGLALSAAELTALGLTANDNHWSLGYSYDSQGNLTQRTDARGITATYTYDALNRNTSVRYSNDPMHTPGVNRIYDGALNGKGRLWQSETLTEQLSGEGDVVSSSGTRTTIASYDALGRPLVQQQSFFATDALNPANVYDVVYTTQRTYDLASHVKTQTYPSGHTVVYNYDATGRLNDRAGSLAFTGNLGDGVARTYASAVSYNEAGRLREERYGTQTPLYHKLDYNVRGQLYSVRLSTVAWATDATNFNRGALVFYYSTPLTAGGSGPDNNGNIVRADSFTPADAQFTNWIAQSDAFTYDALNRLTAVSEMRSTNQESWTQQFRQAYTYDPLGNRTINQTETYGMGIPKPEFILNPNVSDNRLYAPGDLARAEAERHMRYDAAGNLVYDSHTGTGGRTYDAESRMVGTFDALGLTVSYTYDADGRRVGRQSAAGAWWQVYGLDGELLAEYQPRAYAFLPHTEYGYRAGQLLITATNGDEERLKRYVTNIYEGVLGRSPNLYESANALNALGGAQTAAELFAAAQTEAQQLFDSQAYANRQRTNEQFVTDLYFTYVQRAPDAGGFAAWVAATAQYGRTVTRNAFATSDEAQSLATRVYGVQQTDDERVSLFLNHLYQGALGRDAGADYAPKKAQLDAALAQGASQVVTAAQAIGREVYNSAEYAARRPAGQHKQFVTDLYAGLLQRAPDTEGLTNWTSAVARQGRATVLESFVTGGEYRALAQALYREVWWLTPDHLGTPRMVADRTGSLAGIKRHDYLPFGEELLSGAGGRTEQQGYGVSDGVRQKFAASERDGESGLDFMQARFYASAAGRFTSVDPYNVILEVQPLAERNPAQAEAELRAYLSQPQQWNRYAYVANNPLKYVDPTGELLELTGTEQERNAGFERLKALLGAQAAKLLYVREKNGRYYVDYTGKDRDALASNRLGAGKLGVFVANIIDSDRTVEFRVATTYDSKDGRFTVAAAGGGVTVGPKKVSQATHKSSSTRAPVMSPQRSSA